MKWVESSRHGWIPSLAGLPRSQTTLFVPTCRVAAPADSDFFPGTNGWALTFVRDEDETPDTTGFGLGWVAPSSVLAGGTKGLACRLMLVKDVERPLAPVPSWAEPEPPGLNGWAFKLARSFCCSSMIKVSWIWIYVCVCEFMVAMIKVSVCSLPSWEQ